MICPDEKSRFFKPVVVTTRLDIFDESLFHESGVLRLYEESFPPIERDEPADIIRWVLSEDVGEMRTFTMASGQKLSYTLDSRYFILMLARRAIGLGFFTHDQSSCLIYCNYIAVHRCWRGGNRAGEFFDRILEILDGLFPHYRGMVFEVEKFDAERLESIIADLERTGSKEIAEADQGEIRKFLRVVWYYKQRCTLFFDADKGEPLTCRSPCLDPRLPRETWAAGEEDYWIMWLGRGETRQDPSGIRQLWIHAIETIYLEILAKSLVESCPNEGQDYWDYARGMIRDRLAATRSTQISLDRYLDPSTSSLLARWKNLAIDLPI